MDLEVPTNNKKPAIRVTKEYLNSLVNKDTEVKDLTQDDVHSVIHDIGISVLLEELVASLPKLATQGKTSVEYPLLSCIKDRSNDNKKVAEAIKVLGLEMSEVAISDLIYCYVRSYMRHMHDSLGVTIHENNGTITIKW